MDEQYEDTDSDLLRDLRKQIKDLKAERDAAASAAAELKASVRSRTVEEVLSTKGVNAKVAKFIPDDVEDVAAWLDENADVFGFQVDPPANESQPTTDPAVVAATRRQQSLSGAAANPSKIADFTSRLDQAQTPAEVDAIWAEVQNFNL